LEVHGYHYSDVWFSTFCRKIELNCNKIEFCRTLGDVVEYRQENVYISVRVTVRGMAKSWCIFQKLRVVHNAFKAIEGYGFAAQKVES